MMKKRSIFFLALISFVQLYGEKFASNIDELATVISDGDMQAITMNIKKWSEALHVTSILSTISAGILLLQKTFDRFTKSEKKIVKKCIALLVVLWITSTQLFWVVLYQIGFLVKKLEHRETREYVFETLKGMWSKVQIPPIRIDRGGGNV